MDYRVEMKQLTSPLRENVKDIGKKIVGFLRDYGEHDKNDSNPLCLYSLQKFHVLNWVITGNCGASTLCLKKNDNDVLRYNFNAHQPILIIFGRDIAEWICY